MLEKRRLKRRHPIYYLKVFDKNTNGLIGRIVDIHTEGMKLVGESPIQPGTSYKARMDLPKAIGSRDYLDIDIEVIWCALDKNPDFFDTGYSIGQLSNEDKDTINSVFDGFVFNY